jgi:lysophospholipase-2
MPYVKFILPTAPTQPVTMNMGMAMPSWYDIKGLDERSNEECDGILQSCDRIRTILRKEHEDRGLPYSRMALAGFSQGGALSLYTGLQMEDATQKLAGILVLSGYLAGAKKFHLTKGLEDTPILHCHGTRDPLVRFEMANKSMELLKSRGVTNYTVKSYPMQHTVIPSELKDALDFFQQILPPDNSIHVKVKDPSEMSVKELKEAIRQAGLGHKALGLTEKSEFVQLLKKHREN